MAKTTDPDIQLLAALADPTRMEILRELAGAPEVCACDFTSCCDVSQPTVSHHLRVLRDAGAVTSERRGNWVFYRLAPNLQERLGAIAGGFAPGAGAATGAAFASGTLIPASAIKRRAGAASASDGVRGQQPA